MKKFFCAVAMFLAVFMCAAICACQQESENPTDTVYYFVGEEKIASLASEAGVLGPVVCGLIGLIPNCAASVVLTELFLDGVISTGSMLAGLLAGSGVGLLILFRIHKNIKENLIITAVIYASGLIVGILFDIIGIVI